MALFCRYVLLLLLVIAGGGPFRAAASTAENRAFSAADAAFADGLWARADKEFGDFREKFPESPRVGEAVLLQAQSRFRMEQFTAVIELLTSQQDKAGSWADQYLYWIAESHFQNTNFVVAAETYARLIQEFPKTARRLEAAVREATARGRLGEWARVLEMLRQPDGVFQQALTAGTANETVGRGYLLLGEAQLVSGDYAGATATLESIEKLKLRPDLDWQRQYLLCRLHVAQGRLDDALAGTTNLLALAGAARQVQLQAESVAFEAGILEQQKQFDQAIGAYQKNLAENMPASRQREALFKIAELSSAQNKLADAVQTLDRFLTQFPNAAAADMALLAAGELQLKLHLAESPTNRPAASPGTTNLLQQALARFDTLLGAYTNSALTGKALLNRGWCLWLENKFAPSQEAFRLATERLPLSEDQAIARFKWAETQWQLKDFAGAITNYNAIIRDYATLPAVKDRLFEPALYQTVRAALNDGNMEAATDALQKILDWYPEGFAGDRSLLLAGQGFARARDMARARDLFAEFEQRYPESPLLPQVRLAIARTYEQERNWTGAVAQYDAWMGSFTNAAERARAEFSRAWGYSLAGQQTNALRLFTNFVAQFPAHELAARAQWWVADYYFDQGDYQNAERNYQLVFNNTSWPVSKLTYQARLMAGRAAVARLRPQDAIVYFTNLTSDLKCPPELRAEALLFYGDARILESTETNKVENLHEAIRIFGSIPQLFPTNQLVPGAWGRIGECHLQLAETDAAHFQSASNAFQRAFDMPQADISVRSRAKVLLGAVAERQAQQKSGAEQSTLLRTALDHYLDVVYSDKLVRDGETEDLFWTKRAGLDALRLAETLEMWEQAMRLCERLQTLLPPLHANFEKRKLKLQEQFARKS